MKSLKHILTTALVFWGLIAYSQEITEIPDPMFEQFLIDEGIDTDGELNGQVWTADIESLTKLYIDGYTIEYNYHEYIKDITGLEDFISLDTLSVGGTFITKLPLNNLKNLKYLNCSGNDLDEIDLSGNPQLEDLIAIYDPELEPFNTIESIDLSQNPNIKYVYSNVWGGIDLRNGNNSPNMTLHLSNPFGYDGPPYWVCIAVDDPEAASSQEYPYSEWDLGNSPAYWWAHINFTDDLVACNLGVEKTPETRIGIYPNPASDYIYFDQVDRNFLLEIYDLSGKIIRSEEISSTKNRLDVTDFAEGVYFYRMSLDSHRFQYGKLIKK